MRKWLLLSALVALTSGLSAQSYMTVFDGDSLFSEFGTAGSLSDGAYNVVLNSWSNTAFRANDAALMLSSSEIDWDQGPVMFDYRVNSGTALGMFTVSLMLRVEGASPPQQPMASIQYPGATGTITADGNWHTFEADINDFSTGYYDAVTNGAINPNTDYQVILVLQGGNAVDWDLSIDNVMVPVPEPSTYAAIAGALALGVAFLRRRK